MNFSNQLERIKEKLDQAKEKDSRLNFFGSKYHQYVLSESLAEEETRPFEERYNIIIPEAYKTFITNVSNGGAGPYYGLFRFTIDMFYCMVFDPEVYLSQPCQLRVDMSDDEWNEKAILLSKQKSMVHPLDDIDDPKYIEQTNHLYQGLLAIGVQGQNGLFTMLVLNGTYEGRVVYVDSDHLIKPFFTYENNFLDWYERWLDEVVAGYDGIEFGKKRKVQ